MSLKDKAVEAKTITFWNGGGRIYTEPVPLVELEEVEEEIQTLVELLGESKTQLESAAWEIGNKLLSEHDEKITESTATDTSCLIVANKITQTLKKYEK